MHGPSEEDKEHKHAVKVAINNDASCKGHGVVGQSSTADHASNGSGRFVHASHVAPQVQPQKQHQKWQL